MVALVVPRERKCIPMRQVWEGFSLYALFYLLNLFYFILFYFFVVRGPLTVVASPVAEHRLRTHGLSGHGSRAQPLRGTWDPPGPGHKPASPASAGGLSTTAPPGKPPMSFPV